jgi:hypothetical protein
MRQIPFILFLIFAFGSVRAQVSFRTIVPQSAIVEGESFQVQYILEDAENPENLEAPLFKGFRIVTGPNTYTGSANGFDGVKQLRNAVFTLEAIKPGTYIIPGAIVIVDGKKLKSNKAIVEVISIAEARKRYRQQMANAQNSEYFLRPGEDPYQKIGRNLFVKVDIDRKTCVVGEPVVATFKLYSRLESKSDIIKNPGFYGFTVHDMISLNDHQSTIETIEGKPFDVHTIRKVQLYPLGA